MAPQLSPEGPAERRGDEFDWGLPGAVLAYHDTFRIVSTLSVALVESIRPEGTEKWIARDRLASRAVDVYMRGVWTGGYRCSACRRAMVRWMSHTTTGPSKIRKGRLPHSTTRA